MQPEEDKRLGRRASKILESVTLGQSHQISTNKVPLSRQCSTVSAHSGLSNRKLVPWAVFGRLE